MKAGEAKRKTLILLGVTSSSAATPARTIKASDIAATRMRMIAVALYKRVVPRDSTGGEPSAGDIWIVGGEDA